MPFSKLPYVLDALWLIVATPNHFPVFRNEKDSEAGIVPFVAMLYLFRVSNQWCLYFMFLLYFLTLVCFYNQSDWHDIFSWTVGLQIMLIITKMIFSFLQKLLEKMHIVILPKKDSDSGFLEGIQSVSMVWTRIHGVSPFPKIWGSADEFWTSIIPEGWSFLKFQEIRGVGVGAWHFFYINCYIRIVITFPWIYIS